MTPRPRKVRREGFPGQRLLVLPPPLRRSLASHPLLGGLLVTDAGTFPSAAGHRVERPQGASTDLLLVCTAGRGWIRSQGRTAEISAGTLAWLPANAAHAYGSSQDQPWSLVWAHFCGTEVAGWRSLLGWPERSPLAILPVRDPSALGLERVYQALAGGFSPTQAAVASAALRQVFCQAMHAMHHAAADRTAEERVRTVHTRMMEESAAEHQLGELAVSAKLSVSHFSALFRRLFGHAPLDFLIRQRISRAGQLLDTTALSVQDVAVAAGFADPYYFSRCFRRVMGTSPRAYRRIIKG